MYRTNSKFVLEQKVALKNFIKKKKKKTDSLCLKYKGKINVFK